MADESSPEAGLPGLIDRAGPLSAGLLAASTTAAQEGERGVLRQ